MQWTEQWPVNGPLNAVECLKLKLFGLCPGPSISELLGRLGPCDIIEYLVQGMQNIWIADIRFGRIL